MIIQQKVRKTWNNSHLFNFQMYPNSVTSFLPVMFLLHPNTVHSICHLWVSAPLNCNQQWLIYDCWFRDVCLHNAGCLTCWKSHDFTCWQQLSNWIISPGFYKQLSLLNLDMDMQLWVVGGGKGVFTSAHFQFAW